jgi:MFS family permease
VNTHPSGRGYVLGLLLTLNILNYLDRQLPAILLPSIRRDLDLNDSQLAFITGFGFALFFTIMCLPMGALADRYSRRKLLAACVALWSVMTALSGMATNFVQMAICRFGVGIGEAGLTPNSQSLISDLFPQKGRATALGLFSLGIPVGTLIAFLGGGLLDQAFGWRVAFLVMGVPGVILAVLVYFTLREPPRGAADNFIDTGRAPPLMEVVRTLWAIPVYRNMLFGTGFTGLAYIALTTWGPSYLTRSFGLTTAEVGAFLAPAVGLGGMIGTFGGGWLVDKFRDRDVRWVTWLPALTVGLTIIPSVLIFTASSAAAAIWILTVPLVLLPTHLAAFSATSQSVAPLRMRGMAPALSLLVTAGLIGLGIGPQLIGLLSDMLRPSEGEESLRYALLIVVPASAAIAAVFFAAASRTIAADLAQAAARQRAPGPLPTLPAGV